MCRVPGSRQRQRPGGGPGSSPELSPELVAAGAGRDASPADPQPLAPPGPFGRARGRLSRALEPSSRGWALGWVLPLVVQLAHTAVVAPTYHVGSFDDDANYLMAAHVLAGGGWLTTTMPSGATVVANYLPGYPLLLVPLIWLGGALWLPRALSTLCVAALYPLLWAWMRRGAVKPQYRVAVLALLALNPVLATYSTMVMAEAPFLVVLVLALFALDRWERKPGWLWASAAVVLVAYLVWLKEAGIGLVVGLVLYQLWRRRWRRAVGVSAGAGLLLLPGLVARWLTAANIVGDRYAGEINNPTEGGLAHQLLGEVRHDTWAYLHSVLAQSVLPSGSPLPSHGSVHLLLVVIGATVPAFSVVGAVTWYRRHPGPGPWMVWAYLAETLGYPYTNQRRVILVLPVLTTWYVTGAVAVGRFVLALSRPVVSRVVVPVAVVAAVLATTVPASYAFTKNYLYRAGQQSSEFARSPAMSLLKALGPPDAVVETDYRGAVAFFSGHRTAWTAFVRTTPYGPFAGANGGACTASKVRSDLRVDEARFLVVGDFNVPGLMDSPCLLKMASSPATAGAIGAVRLLSTDHDQTSLFELLGPGSSQPGLVDPTASSGPSSPAGVARLARNGHGDAGGTGYEARSVGGEANFEWAWPAGAKLMQVSVGSVTSSALVEGTTVAAQLPDGRWRLVASCDGSVGDGGRCPFLLAVMPQPTRATAVRVSVRTSGRAEVAYLNALGAEGSR